MIYYFLSPKIIYADVLHSFIKTNIHHLGSSVLRKYVDDSFRMDITYQNDNFIEEGLSTLSTTWFVAFADQQNKILTHFQLPKINHQKMLDGFGGNQNMFITEVKKIFMNELLLFFQQNPQYRNRSTPIEESRKQDLLSFIDSVGELKDLGLSHQELSKGFNANVKVVSVYFAKWIQLNTNFRNVEYIDSTEVHSYETDEKPQRNFLESNVKEKKIRFKMDGIYIELVLPYKDSFYENVSSEKALESITKDLFSGMSERIKGQDYLWNDMGFGLLKQRHHKKNTKEQLDYYNQFSPEVELESSFLKMLFSSLGEFESEKKKQHQDTPEDCNHMFAKAYSRFLNSNGFGFGHINKVELN